MSRIRPVAPAPGSPYARITGVGGYRPARVVTNEELCRRIDSSDEWIRTRTGIRARRFAAADETVATMGAIAAGKALAAAGIEPDQVDTVILATFTHDHHTPSAAAEAAFRIGAARAAAFDVSAACAGFCYGIALANDLVRAGTARNVVVIGSEKASAFLDLDDRSTAFLFGDGAGAVVVSPSEEPGIAPPAWGSDGSQLTAIRLPVSALLAVDAGGLPGIRMEGQTVFRWAVTAMAPVAAEALTRAGMTAEDLDVFIPHQANGRIIDSIVKAMRLPEKVTVARDIAETGNTSAASIPLAMEHMLATGTARSGDTALLLGFGAGLVHAAQVVTLP